MKRVNIGLSLILLLSVLFTIPVHGLASDADMGGLTMGELNDWVAMIISRARAIKPLVFGPQAKKTEDGYEVIYDFATLYLNTPDLTDESVVNAITVTEYGVQCPRGIGVSDTQQMLLESFANENQTLLGDRDFAVLYLTDSLPQEALWGWVLRDGQQIQAVQYAVHERISIEEDQYSDSGLVYSIANGYVTAVRAYGLSVGVPLIQVEKTVAGVLSVQKEDGYFAYPQSSMGTDLEPFGREDLLFSGMDFLALTPEAAVSALGTYEVETWIEDDNGEWMRILQWPGAEITFTYTKDKVLRCVDTLAINQRGMEGPRGIQVGDTLSSVLMRLRHSEGEFDGAAAEVLYGDGQTPPYGLAEYTDVTATLRYACKVEGNESINAVTLHMIFVDTTLSELLLYSW